MKALESFIESVDIGRLDTYKDFTICFLQRQNPQKIVLLNYDESLICKILTVTEVNAGTVSELKFANTTGLFPIFIPQGAIFVGLKQNRASTLSFVLKPWQELVAPVVCVEEGRWTSQTKFGRLSAYHMYSRLKKTNMRQTTQSFKEGYRSPENQGEIWEDIRRLKDQKEQKDKQRIHSPDGYIGNIYEHDQAIITNYLKNLPCPDNAFGFISIFQKQFLIGAELFSTPRLLKRNYEALLASIVLESTDEEFLKEQRQKQPMTVQEFLRAISVAPKEHFQSIGRNEDIRFQSDSLIGSALITDGNVIHLEAFRV